jgi:release factor glutamine methyltransferase
VRLLTLPGVFSPISDSWMLARLAAAHAGDGCRVLDLCTGSGVVAVSAALTGAQATAVDVSRRAVWTARLNGRLNGVRVRAVRGDLLDAVPGERFDVIASNPPYVPAESDDLPRKGPQRAWDAGADGRVLLDRILREAPERLRPGGSLLIVQSSLIDTERTLSLMRDGGLDAEVVERRRGPLGPLMLGRVEMLESRGLLEPGVREEDVVVVRGRAAGVMKRPNSGLFAREGLASGAAADLRFTQTRS